MFFKVGIPLPYMEVNLFNSNISFNNITYKKSAFDEKRIPKVISTFQKLDCGDP
jgi:hypothetical protein